MLQACGAKYQIQEEFLDETDVDDVVVTLVNMARKVSSGIGFNILVSWIYSLVLSLLSGSSFYISSICLLSIEGHASICTT